MMQENAKLMAMIFNFVGNLTDDEISLLLNKKAKLKLIEIKKTINTDALFEPTLSDEEVTTLKTFENREEALMFLRSRNFTKKHLQALAKSNNITAYSKDTVETLEKRIVESFVGSKLKFDALLNVKLKD